MDWNSVFQSLTVSDMTRKTLIQRVYDIQSFIDSTQSHLFQPTLFQTPQLDTILQEFFHVQGLHKSTRHYKQSNQLKPSTKYAYISALHQALRSTDTPSFYLEIIKDQIVDIYPHIQRNQEFLPFNHDIIQSLSNTMNHTRYIPAVRILAAFLYYRIHSIKLNQLIQTLIVNHSIDEQENKPPYTLNIQTKQLHTPQTSIHLPDELIHFILTTLPQSQTPLFTNRRGLQYKTPNSLSILFKNAVGYSFKQVQLASRHTTTIPSNQLETNQREQQSQPSEHYNENNSNDDSTHSVHNDEHDDDDPHS